MNKTKLKMSQLQSARVKLFNIAQVSQSNCSMTLPITVAAEMSNIEYDSGDIMRRFAFAEMTFSDGSPLPPPPGQAEIGFFYHGGKGDKSIIVISIPPKASYFIDLDMPGSNWAVTNYFNFDAYDVFHYRDINVAVCNAEFKDNEYIWDNINRAIDYVGRLAKSMPPSRWVMICNHYSRAFVVSEEYDYRVYFSAVGSIHDFTVALGKGGYINVDINYGKIIKLLSYNEYLYIFLERGIMRLRAYGDQREFILKKLDVNAGIIIPGSITSCGDRIIFMSSRGIMVFDGYSASPILLELTESLYEALSLSPYVTSAFVENNYCITYNDAGSYRMIVIDIFNKSYCYCDIDKYRLACRESQGREELLLLSAAVDGNIQMSYPIARMKRYNPDDNYIICPDGVLKSGKIDFNKPEIVKNIRNITSSCDSEYRLIVQDDKGQRYRFNIKRGDNSINIRSKYYIFTIVISGKCDKVVSPYVNVEFM